MNDPIEMVKDHWNDLTKHVLEVAAAGGLGSLDIVQYLLVGRSTLPEDIKKTLTVTDLSPVMVGQNLTEVATGSVDRYVAGLCLQLTPDPDAMLRFTIWGSADRSGMFTIIPAVNKELGFEENAGMHSFFTLGKDLLSLRKRFALAGFKNVQIWPCQCVVELWSAEDFAKYEQKVYSISSRMTR
ncbi:uncharacterized protein PITG_09888 [Phytophthora infestans T30-4]|uniref:Uncharacterized protein n=1 Tax=Phytophthora infestans (strain T30-4) TaxID=403677 RepID=D0NET7_PHYIT|nr:uncharacterized protein PITG_09888 [Phytophthora infestans T30-4]EEY56369.1 conserved hypothetical protein [Phytophthora infestans T30-4]|eukprot:XP_002902443.1 conserved hypothetical protein [Phytophthora infestans T30-4]